MSGARPDGDTEHKMISYTSHDRLNAHLALLKAGRAQDLDRESQMWLAGVLAGLYNAAKGYEDSMQAALQFHSVARVVA